MKARIIAITVLSTILTLIITAVIWYNSVDIDFPLSKAQLIDRTRFSHVGQFEFSDTVVVGDFIGGYLHQDYFIDNVYLGKGQRYQLDLWINGKTGEKERAVMVLPTNGPNFYGL